MKMTYRQIIKQYETPYNLKKAIDKGEVFKIGFDLYSKKKEFRDEVTVFSQHKGVIFTLNSAFYLYDLTDSIPLFFYVATSQTYTRIKEEDIKQSFQDKKIVNLGKTKMKVQSSYINIYDKERLLIELIRFKNRFGFDYYKEIINNYRDQKDLLDIDKIISYLSHFKYGNKILEVIIREVF